MIWKSYRSKTTTACRRAIFVWCKTTSFDPALQKLAAKRLAKELGFSSAEIMSMSFSDMIWWLTD
ncbi:hypothetical protein B0F86_18900 [Pseudomonas syringae]|nr:hypothetical protein B0F86_18900 [Pseudomonas syringae]